MKRKVGKEPEGGTKKREDVGIDNSLASMLSKQQAVNVLNQERDTYNAQLQRAKESDQSPHTTWHGPLSNLISVI